MRCSEYLFFTSLCSDTRALEVRYTMFLLNCALTQVPLEGRYTVFFSFKVGHFSQQFVTLVQWGDVLNMFLEH